jgi:hypothetical protein
MPAGDDQRMRFTRAENVFLSLMTQSSLGRVMFWLPVRATGPSMVSSPFSPLL